MDEVDVEFVKSLFKLKPVGETETLFVSGTLVYEARERISAYAVDKETDYVLWLDSDMIFPPMTMLNLIGDIDGKDIVTGIYSTRRPPFTPTIYTMGAESVESIRTFPEDRLFRIDACGFGCVLMRTEVLKKSFETFNTCFQPEHGFGEDLSFCRRALELGYEIYADPRIMLGHIGKTVITRKTIKEES